MRTGRAAPCELPGSLVACRSSLQGMPRCAEYLSDTQAECAHRGHCPLLLHRWISTILRNRVECTTHGVDRYLLYASVAAHTHGKLSLIRQIYPGTSYSTPGEQQAMQRSWRHRH